MKAPAQGRNRRRSALAGIASFFRQLSLFDTVPDPIPAPPRPLAASSGSRQSIEPHPSIKPAASANTVAESLFPATPAGGTFDVTQHRGNPHVALSLPLESGRIPSFAELCRGPYAHIEVTVKKRLWESWRVAWTRRHEALRLDVPLILEEAPLAVKQSVLEWAVLVTRRGGKRDPVLRARRAELEALIREHLRAPAQAGNAPSRAAKLRLARNRRRVENLEPKGAHHDLDAAFRAVNARYFEGRLEARLTWSARLGGLSTHSVSQDGSGAAFHLISISRGYDSAEVTPEILGGVVYHECLHIAIPPRREGGRRVVHGPDFRRREREYEHFEIWRRWHRDGLPRALRRLRRG